MVNDPGSSFDLGTFIVFLLPGYIWEFLIFCIFDTAVILWTGKSLISSLHPDVGSVAVSLIVLTALGYVIGFVMDTLEHPRADKDEMHAKDAAYTDAINDLCPLVKNAEMKAVLLAQRDQGEKIGSARRDRFLDAMFYRLATSEVWSRQNTHWAFYEALRNLVSLLKYMATIPAFYIALLIIATQTQVSSVTSTVDILSVSLPALGVALAAAVLICILVFAPPLRLQKRIAQERDTDCYVYYRHRAWLVLAYLIDRDLYGLADSGNGEPTSAKVVALPTEASFPHTAGQS